VQRGRDGLRRSLRDVTPQGRFARLADGPPLLNLAGNDYLALCSFPPATPPTWACWALSRGPATWSCKTA